MKQSADVLIIGAESDPHVQAVLQHLDHSRTAVFDASDLPTSRYMLSDESFELLAAGLEVSSTQARGWIRRLSPAGWGHGHPIGSHPAVVAASAVSLIAGVARVPDVEWLSAIDPLLVAESKLVQSRAARGLGIRTPRTVVTNDGQEAARRLGSSRVIVKPLGPGHFTDSTGAEAVVFATELDLSDSANWHLGAAPFLIQELVEARSHLRVVTVCERVWIAELDADGRPLDWREDPGAHDAFQATQGHRSVVTRAASLARQLGIGYSSQDWIVSTRGDYLLLDVNPSGQWLFLPTPISHEVSAAVATWLRGSRV